MATIFGLFLFLTSFLIIGLFEDKKKGFIHTLFFIICWHTAVAFFTQLSGVFTYQVIIFLNILLSLAAVFLLLRYNKKENFFKNFRIDIIAMIVAAIFAFNLYQVHFNYTGKINLVVDQGAVYHEIKNLKYPYPYYSDEWYAIALIKESIVSKSLPLKIPFAERVFFPNVELFFHSFLAEIILLLNLNPLTQYTLLSIAINTLIALILFIFLRMEKIGKLASAISSLSLLYIVSGSNLPGIWNLMPFTMGVLTCLLGFCFISIGNKKMALINSILVFIFYPPFLLFYGIGLLGVKWGRQLKIVFWSSGILILLSLILFYFPPLIFAGAVKFIFSKIFYPSFTFGLTPHYAIYKVIPWPVLILSFLGIFAVFKAKKWLILQIIAGLFLWVFYSFIDYRFMVEFQRAVFFSSLLIIIFFGFGLQWLENYFSKFFSEGKSLVIPLAELLIIFLFLAFAPFYTQRENWADFYLTGKNKEKLVPKAPANMYLTDDDLRIFQNIKDLPAQAGKKFLSPPWKGTVIGVATDNYPASTKAGTITISQNLFQDFSVSDCSGKTAIAKKEKIDYVYSYPFICSGFAKINESEEGFVLYKINSF